MALKPSYNVWRVHLVGEQPNSQISHLGNVNSQGERVFDNHMIILEMGEGMNMIITRGAFLVVLSQSLGPHNLQCQYPCKWCFPIISTIS